MASKLSKSVVKSMSAEQLANLLDEMNKVADEIVAQHDRSMKFILTRAAQCETILNSRSFKDDPMRYHPELLEYIQSIGVKVYQCIGMEEDECNQDNEIN